MPQKEKSTDLFLNSMARFLTVRFYLPSLESDIFENFSFLIGLVFFLLGLLKSVRSNSRSEFIYLDLPWDESLGKPKCYMGSGFGGIAFMGPLLGRISIECFQTYGPHLSLEAAVLLFWSLLGISCREIRLIDAWILGLRGCFRLGPGELNLRFDLTLQIVVGAARFVNESECSFHIWQFESTFAL